MAAKVEHYYDSAWHDITDYVQTIGKVPYDTRNRDYTPRAESLSMGVAVTIRDLYGVSDFEFSIDDRFRISIGSDYIFAGYAEKSNFDYNQNIFSLTIDPDYLKLESVIIDYATLHAAIFVDATSGTQYRKRSYYMMPIVFVNHLLTQLFDLAGLTLDTSEVDDIEAIAGTDPHDSTAISISYKELFIGESELYCLGQSAAAYHTVIDDTIWDYNDKKINAWQLAQTICSALKYKILRTDASSYKLSFKTNNISVVDDLKFAYSYGKNRAEKTTSDIGLSLVRADWKDYLAGSAVTELATATIGKHGGLNWIDQLRIYAVHERTTFDDAKCVPISNVYYYGAVSRIATSSAHGLSAGNEIIVCGVAGYSSINNDMLVNSSTVDKVNSTTEIEVGPKFQETYIEGGWIYKDTFANYIHGFYLIILSPGEISESETVSYAINYNDEIGSVTIPNVISRQVKALTHNYDEESILTNSDVTESDIVENYIGVDWDTSEIKQEIYP